MSKFYKNFPNYDDDSDYNTNANSYYKDLGRKNKLIKLLAKRIWEYDNTLNETLGTIEKRLNDYIDENNRLLTERLNNWDKRIDELDEEVSHIFVEWLNDGTLEEIINNDVLGNKADKTYVDELNENVATKLEQKAINVKTLGAKGDGITDDTSIFKQAISEAISMNTGVYIPQGEYVIKDTLIIGDNTDHGDIPEQLKIVGNHMRKTRLLFKPNQNGKPLFYFSANAGYAVLQDMELIDSNPRENIGIRMKDWYDNAGRANWKNHIERVHIANFDIGLDLQGGEDQVNHADDTHLDGLTLEKVAFWNYNKGIVFNNTQAVQLQGYDVDFISTFDGNENSTALWLNVGTTFNFTGGSWIGKGQFVRLNSSPTYFASNYVLKNIRFEFRNGNTRPIIEYADRTQGNGNWSVTAYINMEIENCVGIAYGQDITLIKTPVHGDVLFRENMFLTGTYKSDVYQTAETIQSTSTRKGSRGSLVFNGNTPIKINLLRDNDKYLESIETPRIKVINEKHGSAYSNTSIDEHGYYTSRTKNMDIERSGGLVQTERKITGRRITNNRLPSEIKIRLPEHAIVLNAIFPRSIGFLDKHNIEIYMVKDNDKWLNPDQFNISEDAIQLLNKPIPTDIERGNLVLPISTPNPHSFIGNGYVLKTTTVEGSNWTEGRLLVRFVDSETGDLVGSSIPPIEYFFIEYI